MNRLTKEVIKNVIYIGLILLFASVCTYFIYNKFQNTRDVDFSSKSLDVVYHDSGDKISINKVIPMTDSVGLSSNAYALSIKNNLTVGVKYVVKIVDDNLNVPSENVIPLEDIRISIKNGKANNEIYNLNELENGVLLEDEVGPLEKKDLSIRLWVNKDSGLSNTSDMKYYGTIKILEIEDDE